MPPKCSLCGEAHPANYKDYIKHKILQKTRNSKSKEYNFVKNYTSSQLPQSSSHPINAYHQEPPVYVNPSPNHVTRQPSCAQATTGTSPVLNSNQPNQYNSPDNYLTKQLGSFIHELQSLLTPLISLLTILINKLIEK